MNLFQTYTNDEIDNYKVILSGGGGTIMGILDTDSLDISMGMEMSDSVLADGIGSTLMGGAKAIAGKLMGDFGVGLIEKAGVQRMSATVKTWAGGTNPSFSIPILIVPGGFGASSYSAINQTVAKWTMPKTESGILLTNIYPASKLKELTTNPKALDGSLISITIGNWFSTGAVFFATSVSQSYTTITDDSGKPLYMKLNVSLTAYRQLEASEISSWVTV